MMKNQSMAAQKINGAPAATKIHGGTEKAVWPVRDTSPKHLQQGVCADHDQKHVAKASLDVLADRHRGPIVSPSRRWSHGTPSPGLIFF